MPPSSLSAYSRVSTFQPFERRVFLVHLEQFGGEQSGFVAAGGRADFEDGAAGVGLVARQQGQADFLAQTGQAFLEVVELGLGEAAHFGVGEQGFGFGLRALGGAQLVDAFDDRLEVGELLAGAGETVAADAFAQHGAQLGGAADDLVELAVQAAAHRSFSASSASATSDC